MNHTRHNLPERPQDAQRDERARNRLDARPATVGPAGGHTERTKPGDAPGQTQPRVGADTEPGRAGQEGKATVATHKFERGTFGGVDLDGHTMRDAVNHLRPEGAPKVEGEPIYDGGDWTWRTRAGWTVTVYPEPGDAGHAIGWAPRGDGPMFSIEPDGSRGFVGEWSPARERVAV